MSEWISVKDRLPEIKEREPRQNPCSDPVLMTDGENMSVGRRWTCGEYEHFLPDYREEFSRATHWMPLPKPPKEKSAPACAQEKGS